MLKYLYRKCFKALYDTSALLKYLYRECFKARYRECCKALYGPSLSTYCMIMTTWALWASFRETLGPASPILNHETAEALVARISLRFGIRVRVPN